MSTTTMEHTTGSAAVHRLLDRELEFSPAYRVHYSDHLAMMLAALDQMGASAAELESRYDDRIRNDDGDPRDDRPELERRIREVATLGIDETVRRRVPALVTGPATALFHPAIRLAYALDLGHEGQVAAALLDWETRFEELPLPDPTTGDRSLDDVAARLAAYPSSTWPTTWDLAASARRPELAAAMDGLALDHITLDDIASFALATHTAAAQFTSLHMVTGARALHRIGRVVADDTARRMAREAAKEMVMLHTVVGAPALLDEPATQRLRAMPLPSKQEVAAAGVAARDPHDVKLTNVALVEEERTGDRLYRYVAARELGLVT